MENSTATRSHLRPTRAKAREPSGEAPALGRTRHRKASRRRDFAKRLIDLTLGSALIIMLIPIMLVIAAAVKLDSRGPVLFRQRRLGRGMKPFAVLKFRTMLAGASPEVHKRYIAKLAGSSANGKASDNGNGREAAEGNMKKLTADPRVTAVGRFLRRTSLDELPQLFNVLGGTMSLIGPRPALGYELEHYRPVHYRRFEVRPGITGLWQVSGRSSLSFHEMLDLDVEYSTNPTLATDLGILARTPFAATRHAA